MGSPMLLSLLTLILVCTGIVYCQRPAVVNIGAVFTHESIIGRVAKVAIEAAVADINANSRVLGGTKLKLILEDSYCNVFLGSIGVFRLLEEGVVAIIGPQSSAIAHMISFISNGIQVPLLSFAATDPTLTASQFPYFFRTTVSDSYQMVAMADLISYYEWKEVVAIYVDDDYGRGGISFLGDELAKRMSKISYRIALPATHNFSQIQNLIENTNSIGSRVYVVHVNPDSGLMIFDIAQRLNMMTEEYVWLATDWLSTALDSLASDRLTTLKSVQGIVGFRQNSPNSDQKKAFILRWKELRRKGIANSELNAYGLCAYDTVWTVARAINDYLNDNGNISFSSNDKLHDMQRTMLQLEKLKIFDGGPMLHKKIMQTNFTGLTGAIQFDSDRNLINGTYEVININGSIVKRIGYWSNYSGLSVQSPESLYGKSGKSQVELRENQQLDPVIWPSGKTQKPRGWVSANDKRPLVIVVPRRTSFVEFVMVTNDSHKIEGYAIDVFNEALKYIPYKVPCRFEPFGDGQSNPSYTRMVRKVAENVYDAAVGDIAIVTSRTRIVDFTQPYIATGLVIVVPIKSKKSTAWVFLRPFTVEMWCATGASFLLIGGVIWLLEHRLNDEFRGPPRRQLITTILFSFSTLFKTQQETTTSALAKMVMMVWFFLLMVISSSYTASLTSILTVQQLSSPITGIDSLIASNGRIGYQVGSFAKSYLRDTLNVPISRLVSLKDPQEYERALRLGSGNGGVAAIVDELPYVELFLSKQNEFNIIGQMFTKRGWGFAFQRGSPLAVDMSSAILKLSENGKLQKIHDKWLCPGKCVAQKGHTPEANQLQLKCFEGLFIFCGLVTVAALIVFMQRAIRQYIRFKRHHPTQTSGVELSENTGCSKVCTSFIDFIDEKEEAIKNMFKQQENSQSQPN